MKKRLIFIAVLFVVLAACSNFRGGAGFISGAGVLAVHDRRAPKMIVDDQSISVKTNLALSRDELLKDSHISTMNYNGTLLLVGQASEREVKSKVEELIEKIPGIKKVHNQIVVAPNISFSRRMKDSWLTTQVKAKLLSIRDIGPNRVKVLTEDSKVYLMGILTDDETEIVADAVTKIKGVEEVVVIFDKSDK